MVKVVVVDVCDGECYDVGDGKCDGLSGSVCCGGEGLGEMIDF